MTEKQCEDHAKRIETIAERQSGIIDSMTEMQSDVRDIRTAICGDDKMGHRGLIKRMDKMEATQRVATIIGMSMLLAMGLVFGKVSGVFSWAINRIPF